MRISKLTLALVGLLCLSPLAAQSQDERSLSAWYAQFHKYNIEGTPYFFTNDTQVRYYKVADDTNQVVARAGFGASLADGFTLSSGYTFITTESESNPKTNQDENNLYQDLIYSHALDRVSIRHRLRIEERWIERAHFRMRFRYGIYATVPLSAPVLKQDVWYLSLFNEVFFNQTRSEVKAFDRNWTYAAVGYSLLPKGKIQLGLLQETTSDFSRSIMRLSWHQSFSL